MRSNTSSHHQCRGDAGPSLDPVATRRRVERLIELADERARHEIELVALAGHLATTRWWHLDGAKTPENWLATHAGLNPHEARRLLRRAEVCDRLPAFGHAYRNGELPAAFLDALSQAIGTRWSDAHHDEAELLRRARSCCTLTRWRDLLGDWSARRSPADAEERYAERSHTMHRDLFGDLVGRYRLTGEDAATFASAIDAHTDTADQGAARTLSQRRADALVDAVTDGEGPEINLVIDARHLADPTYPNPAHPAPDTAGPTGQADLEAPAPIPCAPHRWDGLLPHAHGQRLAGLDARCDIDSSGIAPLTAARLACDAQWRTLTAAGGQLQLGRKQRTFTRSQRNALAALYRRCVFPGCDTIYARCELHHIQPWNQGGPTDLTNAAPLCRSHHHLVHEHGWSLTRADDETITWHPPPDQRSAWVEHLLQPRDQRQLDAHLSAREPQPA